MRHISYFSFIEKIAVKGLDEFYKVNYSYKFLLDNFREGGKLEIIRMKQNGADWEIIGKEFSTDEKFWKLPFTSKGYSPTEEAIAAFLEANKFFEAATIHGWSVQQQSGYNENNVYEAVIRHFVKNPMELSSQAKFEKWFTIYFEQEFKMLFQFLCDEIENKVDEFSPAKNDERLSFEEIAAYEKKLMLLFEANHKTYETKYKEDLYLNFISRVAKLFSDLKAEYPLLYDNLERIAQESRKQFDRLTWYPNVEAFFYLFKELKDNAVIRKESKGRVTFEELAESLMKVFYIPTEKGQNEEYSLQSFMKKLQDPNLNPSNEHVKKIKTLVKELISEMNKLD